MSWVLVALTFGACELNQIFRDESEASMREVRPLRSFRARFLQIRLGSESCDQISASPNRPKRAKSRDKTAGSLFTRIYTLVKFSQTKRCFLILLVLKTKHTKINDTSTSL